MKPRPKRKWWQITVGEEQRRRFNRIAEHDKRNFATTFEVILSEALERRGLEVGSGKPQ